MSIERELTTIKFKTNESFEKYENLNENFRNSAIREHCRKCVGTKIENKMPKGFRHIERMNDKGLMNQICMVSVSCKSIKAD